MNEFGLDIDSLGYLIVASDRLDDWREFAGPSLGMQIVDRGSSQVALRMDDREQRLMITRERSDARYTIGWQATSAAAMERVAARLDAAGIAVARGSRALCSERMVGDLIGFADPNGNRIELFVDPAIADATFAPGRNHSGFRTGPLGFGHIVLTAPSVDGMIEFYRDLLGFRVSDYQLSPFPAYFFHVNRRHHSFAVIQLGQAGIHHVLVEHGMLDDVGQGLDVMKKNGHNIGVTLGRHSNDFMTSFYVHTPSPFMIECGWGGRDIDPSTWTPYELTRGPSLWGHDRDWLTPEQFAEAERIRLVAAAEGFRAPVNVLDGRYLVCADALPPMQPGLDAAAARD